MSGTIFSILPPIIAIVMVLITRRVLLSLGAGIVLGALLIHSFAPVDSLTTLWKSFQVTFWDGGLNTYNVFIILFLFLLGIITAFVSLSGGSRAFAEWAVKHIKTRRGAKLLTAFLGIIIFIDDYFNALAVGQVSKPLTDRHRVSRAKLAYIIDSTSAPICVVSPISSWGAYIIAIIGTILATHGISEYTALSAFIQMIPMNLYVITAILMVFVTTIFNINLGSMKVHEQRAIKRGEMIDPAKPVIGDLKQNLPQSEKGTIGDLMWPIIALVIGTVGSMIWTGFGATDENRTLLAIFENTDVAASLLYGGLLGLFVAFILFFNQVITKKSISTGLFFKGIIEGVKSMLPAIYILLLAWMVVDLIGQLETGTYLASLVEKANLSVAYLPVILFIIAGVMAFSTGTSWGTFGIMLPIAGEIMASTDISMLLPALAAVLAGSVFGDHCSPISDTTILSSTGAGSHHIDHVLTQLPYALISAIIATVGFIVIGITGSTILGIMVVLLSLLVFTFVFRQQKTTVLE